MSDAVPVDDPSFWEGRYRRGESPWDLGEPAPPLANWLGSLDAPTNRRRVAVLGCGYGNDALLFARAGHAVTGFDFAPTALNAARERAAAEGLDMRFVQADVFALPAQHVGAFDLIVEHTFFCAIHPKRRGEYVAVVRDLLVPGGELVGLFYAHGRSGGPPYSTTREEIERLFRPAFAIRRLEAARDSVPQRAGEELFAIMSKLAPGDS